MTTRDAVKAALWTALFTFAGVFGITALGWLADVAAWASSSGARPLPGLDVLGYGAVAAAAAAASGVVNLVVRYAQARGIVPGGDTGPNYTTTTTPAARAGQVGQAALGTVIAVLLVVVLVVLLVRML